MYNLKTAEFKSPLGKNMYFSYREGTNDRDTIQGAFVEDEYGICKLDFKKGDTVIDLGAHIGGVTLLLASMRPDLKIFAWEAHKANFELLRKNIEDNNPKSQINIFNQAMWFYDNDKVKLYYGDNSETGRSHKFIGSLFATRDFYNKSVFKEVDCVNLSEAFEENRIFSCKFMKIDIEGAEFGVFKAAPKDILSMIDRVHGEYHNILPETLKNPRKTLIKLCKGVYTDITPGGSSTGPVGPFQFVKK